MLGPYEIHQKHLDDVQELLQWRDRRDTVTKKLLSDLDPEMWDGPDCSSDLLRSIRLNKDWYLDLAFNFLDKMASVMVKGAHYPYRIPQVYAPELLRRERLYLSAQITQMFYTKDDESHWCIQIFETGEIKIQLDEPWTPWARNMWLFGLKGPAESDFMTPVIAKLEFFDGVEFLRNGEGINLRRHTQKFHALVDCPFGFAHTLEKPDFDRFGPVLDWSRAVYVGYPDRSDPTHSSVDQSQNQSELNGPKIDAFD